MLKSRGFTPDFGNRLGPRPCHIMAVVDLSGIQGHAMTPYGDIAQRIDSVKRDLVGPTPRRN